MAGRKPPVGESGAVEDGRSGDPGLPRGVHVSRREVPRIEYQHDGIVALTEPDADPEPLRIMFRDISEKGVGLLYSGHLEPGSRCNVQLKTLDGRVVSVAAAVVRCRSLSEFVNEIGVRFDQLINLREFVRTD